MLYKKTITYTVNTDKGGERRTGHAFYIDCGGVLIPVQIAYKPDKETGKDRNYRAYKALLTDYAQELPESKPHGNKLPS